MKKNNQYYFILITCIFLCWVNGFAILSASAQHRLTILVKNNAVTSPSDSIYAAGEFNNWNPASNSFLFSKTKDAFSLVIEDIKAGTYSFKITKGSWQTVECNANGTNISNREVFINTDTTIVCEVVAWRAGDVKSSLVSTASKNVQILNTDFEMPQLNRKRTIRIYLPEGYKNTNKRYPVLYMQDGQNLFDEATAGFGEWGVDETLDSLEKVKRATCIVVGIDNSSKRFTEYNPYYFERFGEGEGNAYADFIALTLKPFIDSSFRTLPQKSTSLIAGSSMGGLISFFTMLKYPEVFGKAGVFSPAFWTADSIKAYNIKQASKTAGKVFFYVGAAEGASYINDMETIAQDFGLKTTGTAYCLIDAEGKHNESAWRKWFPEFIRWALIDVNNYIIQLKD